ncbi:MAG TPA: hypothetical protein VN665_02960 [Candidatus Paceibacterota bacterium]|nr:hypothetical protein [Candidatus Paceibacterota bacterium]
MIKRAVLSVAFAGFAALPTASYAEDDAARIILASTTQPVAECGGTQYSPELKSGCYKVPAATETFDRNIVGLRIQTAVTSDKVWGQLPEPLRVKAEVPVAGVKPVYKGQRRSIAAVRKQCGKNCTYVSAQSAYGKQIARQMQRQMGVQLASVIGFFVPFPASLLVNTITCAGVSTAFDAKEYREDYHLEPTQEQYSSAFGSNALYCSPVGGMIAAAETKSPLRFFGALLGFSGYFWNMPAGLSYGVSAAQMAGGYTGNQGAAKATKVASTGHKGKGKWAAAKQPEPKPAMVAAVQP